MEEKKKNYWEWVLLDRSDGRHCRECQGRRGVGAWRWAAHRRLLAQSHGQGASVQDWTLRPKEVDTRECRSVHLLGAQLGSSDWLWSSSSSSPLRAVSESHPQGTAGQRCPRLMQADPQAGEASRTARRTGRVQQQGPPWHRGEEGSASFCSLTPWRDALLRTQITLEKSLAGTESYPRISPNKLCQWNQREGIPQWKQVKCSRENLAKALFSHLVTHLENADFNPRTWEGNPEKGPTAVEAMFSYKFHPEGCSQKPCNGFVSEAHRPDDFSATVRRPRDLPETAPAGACRDQSGEHTWTIHTPFHSHLVFLFIFTLLQQNKVPCNKIRSLVTT